MQNTGIMQEVRGLLAKGKTSRQIIDSGYAPGTVYRVQRTTRRERLKAEAPQAPSVAQAAVRSEISTKAANAAEANIIEVVSRRVEINSMLLQIAKKVTEEEWNWPVLEMGDWLDTFLFWTMKQKGIVIGAYQVTDISDSD